MRGAVISPSPTRSVSGLTKRAWSRISVTRSIPASHCSLPVRLSTATFCTRAVTAGMAMPIGPSIVTP
jgi:hypothetical protein